MLNQNTHTYREPGQIRRLSYRLQYFFISDNGKVKLCNNRLHNAIVIFRNRIFHCVLILLSIYGSVFIVIFRNDCIQSGRQINATSYMLYIRQSSKTIGLFAVKES